MKAKTHCMTYWICSAFISLFSLTSCSENKSQNNRMSEEKIITGIKTDTATFGTGCFWCTEAIFQRLNGVVKVIS